MGSLYRWLDGPLRSQIVRVWGGWVRPAPLQDDPSWYETGLSEDELIGILPARPIGDESGEDLSPDAIEFLFADEDDADRPEPEEPEDSEAALSPVDVVLLPEPGVCSTRPASIPQWLVDEKAADRLRDRRTASSAVGRSSAAQPLSTSTTRSSGRSAEGEAAAAGSRPPAKDECAPAGRAPRGRWDDLAWPLAWLAGQLAELLEPRWVVQADVPCRFGPYRAVQLRAPLAVVEPAQWETARGGVLTDAPRLVIEVVASGNTGVVLRRRVDQWLGYGAGEVWVVDPERGWLTAERPGREPSWYAPPAPLPLGALAPGRCLDLAPLFRPTAARPGGAGPAGRLDTTRARR